MALILFTLFSLQAFLPFCYPSPLEPVITAGPGLGVAYGIELLPRAQTCSWICAPCVPITTCTTCGTHATATIAIECCSMELDTSPCPTTTALPPGSTIYVYTVQTLTFAGRPTSLEIGTNTLTAGGSAITVSGHIFSIPTKGTGGIIEDGSTTSLGSPIATVTGTENHKTTVGKTTNTGETTNTGGSKTTGGKNTSLPISVMARKLF